MSRFVVIVCAGLLAWNAPAQTGFPQAFRSEVSRGRDTGSRTSSSGQFITHDSTEFLWRPLTLDPSVESKFVHLDASLLAVSCEHIKSALLRELQAPDHWRGTVSVFLHHASGPNESVTIAPTVNGREWTFYMAVPDTIERTRLVSAVVGVLLLEIANREAERSAELPAWLTQGLTCQLMTEHPDDLVFDRPRRSENGVHLERILIPDSVQGDPLRVAHEILQARPPLTFAELSWPEPGFEESDPYRASAQLFVNELSHLPDGQRCLRTMIQELPRHLNWQLSFLDAFSTRFPSELEAEKWWSLTVVNFTGRNLSRTWPPAESWRKLTEIIRTGAEVRSADNDLPLRTEVTLQNLISDWDYAAQAGVLKTKIAQLGLLRASVSQDCVYLADDYREVLQAYVKKREKTGWFRRARAQHILGLDAIALETIRQLDDLDARRAQSQPEPGAARQITASLPGDR